MVLDLKTGKQITNENPANENSILWDTNLGQDFQNNKAKNYVLGIVTNFVGVASNRHQIETNGTLNRYLYMEYDVPTDLDTLIFIITPKYVTDFSNPIYYKIVSKYIITIKK